MENQSLGGFRRFASLVAISVLSASLAACGGSGDAPPSSYAYVASADVQGQQVPGAVYQYAIAPDGSLAPLTVASVPAGITPTAMISDPTGHHVYVANLGDATLSQYAVGAGGGLMALSPAVVDIPRPYPSTAAYSLSMDPTGRFLYIAITALDAPQPSASIAQYSVGSDGTLTPLSSAYINVPASAQRSLAIDPSGQYAYLAGATSTGGQVYQFSIAGDGALSPLSPASVAATQTPIGVAIAPGGHAAYVLSRCIDSACDGLVARYTIGADGALTSTGTTTLTGSHVNPVAMVDDGSGTSAYLLTNSMGVDTNTGAVYQYAIDSMGALVPYTPSSVPLASGAVAESINGSNLYALSNNKVGFASGSSSGGHVDVYAIGPDGLLTAVSTTPVEGSYPTAMILVRAH